MSNDAGLDTAAYLTRIAYSGATDPTVDVLHELVAAHIRSIPFENLDPLMGVPVGDLGPTPLADKLVTRGRGGYCYEHNGLMGYVLEELGFGVQRLAGRVVWMQAPGSPLPAVTHNVLSVTAPGDDEPFLVDVGFGGQTLSSPIRLQPGPVQQTRHEPYQLVSVPDGLALEAQVRDKWQRLYEFSEKPQPRIDLEVGSWYVSTHPGSVFVVGLTAALITDDARWNLRGRNLAVHRSGTTEKVRFDTAAQVLDALVMRFGIDLSGFDRGALEARVTAVLDA